jgi:hypothetical protein
MRSRDGASVAVILALSISCSDAPVENGSMSRTGSAAANAVELNTVEGLIGALFPNGLEDAALHRWIATRGALGRDDSKVARRHMLQLADFAIKMEKQNRLDDPDGDGDMTVNDGVMKLISLMFGAVMPGVPAPPTDLSGDFVVAVVDGSHQTVVTPSEFAGVEFPAGAAAEPFLLLIRQNEFPAFERCQGPLRTRLCQYPRFYEFHPFPYTVLTRAAKFGVCHVTEGPMAPGKDIDGRLRLAHDAPPGAPRKGYQTVDGAEILPFARVAFLECHPHGELPSVDRIGAIRSTRDALDVGKRVVGGLAYLAGELLLPRKAFAIDMGGGGDSDFFSNFNVVDPGPPPGSNPDVTPDIVIDSRNPKMRSSPRDP